MKKQEFERNWEVEGNLSQLVDMLPEDYKEERYKLCRINTMLACKAFEAQKRLDRELTGFSQRHLGLELNLSLLDELGIDYIPNATDSITLRLMQNPVDYSAKLKLRLNYQNGIVRFDVEDNGLGIDEDVEPGLFNKYIDSKKLNYREDSYRLTHGVMGTGLKNRFEEVTKLNGRVGFHNKGKDMGAIFWYEIPIESVIKENPEQGK